MRAVALAACALLLAGCGGGESASPGAELLSAYGCGGCHTIPEVEGADGRVGPDLGDLDETIAGELPTSRESLVRWIAAPKQVEPGTLMPDLGVSEQEAAQIADFLLERQG